MGFHQEFAVAWQLTAGGGEPLEALAAALQAGAERCRGLLRRELEHQAKSLAAPPARLAEYLGWCEQRWELEPRAEGEYFCWQERGFAAVRGERPAEAIRCFEAAAKCAPPGSAQRALALAHLARAYTADDEPRAAAATALEAAEACPREARFQYEAAVCQVRRMRVGEAIAALSQAIALDPVYWSVAAADPALDPIREHVEALIEDARAHERDQARHALENSTRVLKRLRDLGIADQLAEPTAALADLEKTLAQGTVFACREVAAAARQALARPLAAALKALDERMAANRAQRERTQAELREQISALRVQAEEAARKAASYGQGVLGFATRGRRRQAEQRCLELETALRDTEARLAAETAQLDRDLAVLQQHKQFCERAGA